MDVEALYEKYGPMVMRRCRQLLKDETEALDATQDVFVQVLRRRDRLFYLRRLPQEVPLCYQS